MEDQAQNETHPGTSSLPTFLHFAFSRLGKERI
jgi:hypothetical protein